MEFKTGDIVMFRSMSPTNDGHPSLPGLHKITDPFYDPKYLDPVPTLVYLNNDHNKTYNIDRLIKIDPKTMTTLQRILCDLE